MKFLSEYEVAYNKDFQNTVIGGLSGIDHDREKNLYYLLSDDRSERNPARFYEVEVIVRNNKIDSVIFLQTNFFKNNVSKVYPDSHNDPYHTPDPEAIRYNNRKNTILWCSEGERVVRPNRIVLEDPAITETTIDGNYIDTFILPSQLHMQRGESGPRQNGVFEGLAFADNYKTLFASVEEPLYNDGPRAGSGDSGGITRILKYNTSSRKVIAQYAYMIDAVAHPAVPLGSFKINGISEILSIGDNKLIVVERSFSTGLPACTIKVFLADLSAADNVDTVFSLKNKRGVKMVSKKLLLNTDSLGFYIDNIEGVTFGPTLTNGHSSLLFVSDNNFSSAQKTQFLLFEIE
ncbi:MAG: esterase-like activity of phytase family protein [Ginsengibacter sp.]